LALSALVHRRTVFRTRAKCWRHSRPSARWTDRTPKRQELNGMESNRIESKIKVKMYVQLALHFMWVCFRPMYFGDSPSDPRRNVEHLRTTLVCVISNCKLGFAGLQGERWIMCRGRQPATVPAYCCGAHLRLAGKRSGMHQLEGGCRCRCTGGASTKLKRYSIKHEEHPPSSSRTALYNSRKHHEPNTNTPSQISLLGLPSQERWTAGRSLFRT